MTQVDSIKLIEYLCFDAINEGPRQIDSIWYSHALFGKVTHLSVDDIDASNPIGIGVLAITSSYTSNGKAEQGRMKITGRSLHQNFARKSNPYRGQLRHRKAEFQFGQNQSKKREE